MKDKSLPLQGIALYHRLLGVGSSRTSLFKNVGRNSLVLFYWWIISAIEGNLPAVPLGWKYFRYRRSCIRRERPLRISSDISLKNNFIMEIPLFQELLLALDIFETLVIIHIMPGGARTTGPWSFFMFVDGPVICTTVDVLHNSI